MHTNKRLTILSKAEQIALYALPDFNDSQRNEYMILSGDEQSLALSRSTASAQAYCMLQIAYFKTKQAFFKFTWENVPAEDVEFIAKNYFSGKVDKSAITKHEIYTQREQIIKFFGYKTCSESEEIFLSAYLSQIVKRGINIKFILTELIAYLNKNKIIRPGYTTLQDIISEALQVERNRLGALIIGALDKETEIDLKQLLIRDNALLELAALKQDAKDFKCHMMKAECRKLEAIKPLYLVAKSLLPKLEISQQNMQCYAELAIQYDIYDLRRMPISQSSLYLLCYIWYRYQQLSDNLVTAFCHHLRKFDDETKNTAQEKYNQYASQQQNQSPIIGKLLQLYVDDSLANEISFGDIRNKYAFPLMSKDKLCSTVQQMIQKPTTELSLRWQVVDKIGHRFKRHLRTLFSAIDLSSQKTDNQWIAIAIKLKQTLQQKQNLNSLCEEDDYIKLVPNKLIPHLITIDKDKKTLQADRFEFWIYRQCTKRLESGELYVDDSLSHKCFDHELLHLADNDPRLKNFDLPCLHRPIEEQLAESYRELRELWTLFNIKLKRGELKHLQYDVVTKELSWHKMKYGDNEEIKHKFYEQLPHNDITDVLRFVSERCNFLSAFLPLQQRYIKQTIDEDALLAVIITQAMNHSRGKMSEISDISAHILDRVYGQYLRATSLCEANDFISNAIAELPIFPYYSLDLMTLYGSVDGQKYGVDHPTTKARHAKKYWGKGRGVVAYTLLLNHIPLQAKTIGAHEHESYFVFDICQSNTTDIIPDVVSGDMHSINKANFAILKWFKTDFRPRFTNVDSQLKHLYCGDDMANYAGYLVKPVEQLDHQLMVDEWSNIKPIVVTLASKEITQSKIIRKLCNYKQNRTRKAIFEFDKLYRSIYTLKYLLDPKMQKDVHRSQNRIESYHQLRGAIAQVNGKKQLSGRTDIEVDISNQCGRLIANAIIYYNSALLSQLLEKYKRESNHRAIRKLQRISPVAWQHIHLLGHYVFCSNKHAIDLEALIAKLTMD